MPDWLIGLFRSGAVATFALSILILEAVILYTLRGRIGVRLAAVVFNIASGIALLLALRIAITDPQNFTGIAFWLAVGFVAHVADLVVRLGK